MSPLTSVMFAAVLLVAQVRGDTGTEAERAITDQSLLDWWAGNGLPPEDYVLSKFDTKKWVFLGEYHRFKDDVDLVAGLIPKLHL